MERVHIRFGDLPEDGKSMNWETDEEEAGVSVFAAEYDEDEDTLTLILHRDSNGAEINMLFSDRPVYLITGDVLDETGSDGEPLIANAAARLLDIDPATISYCNA